MHLHPRTQIVNSARTDLRIVIGEWLRKHDLTTSEEIMLLTSVPGDLITGAMREIIKLEREEISGGPASKLAADS